jgi:hypothetical protein
MTVTNELESMWKESALAYFKALYQKLPGGTVGNYENLGEDSRCAGRDSNNAPSQYMSKAAPGSSVTACLRPLYLLRPSIVCISFIQLRKK